MKSVITRGLVLAILGLSLGGTAPAWANLQLYDFLDGLPQTIVGIYERNSTNNEAIPFTAQVFSGGNNECLLLEMVDTQGVPLEIVLVSPAGRVWYDLNHGSNGLPRVQAITNIKGYYTLHVSHDTGAIPVATFQLKYGRYSPGNAQCPSNRDTQPQPLQGDPNGW